MPDEPEITVSYRDSSQNSLQPLRARPASDSDATMRAPLGDIRKLYEASQKQQQEAARDARDEWADFQAPAPAPSAITRPNPEEVEAAAEELAMTSGTLKDELDEVDFFLQQKMFDEARELLKSLQARYPHSKAVQSKLKEASAEAVVEDVVIDVDLEDLEVTQPPMNLTMPTSPNPVSATEASGAFRLGVSLRNRGQYAQAVSEFQKAMRDTKRAARAALMTGLCYRDQNQLKEAVEIFKQAVHMPNLSDADLSELHYQLGRTYEQIGDPKEAIYFYQTAMKREGRFKDAAERIQTLQNRTGRIAQR